MVSEHSGYATRSGDFTVIFQRISALCSGSVGGCMAETPCSGRSHHRALCGRLRPRLPRGDRCTTVPRSTQGTVCQVSLVTAPREDATDRVWPQCGQATIAARRRPSRDIRLPGIHAYQRENTKGVFHHPPHLGVEENEGQAERAKRQAETNGTL